MASYRARRIAGTILIIPAVLWLAYIALDFILLKALGADIHWAPYAGVRFGSIVPPIRLAIFPLLVLPIACLWLGLHMRRPAR